MLFLLSLDVFLSVLKLFTKSSILYIGFAFESLRSLLVPRLSFILCEKTYISFFIFKAYSTLLIVPEFSSASHTTKTSPNATTNSFLIGKVQGALGVVFLNIDKTKPSFSISFIRFLLTLGYLISKDVPATIIVLATPAFLCAIASTPIAPPLTMHIPILDSFEDNSAVVAFV